MSFRSLQRIIKRPTEKYYLQKRVTYQKEHNQIKDEVGNVIRKDDVGNISETWETVQELHGVIQHRQDDDADYQEERPQDGDQYIIIPQDCEDLNLYAK